MQKKITCNFFKKLRRELGLSWCSGNLRSATEKCPSVNVEKFSLFVIIVSEAVVYNDVNFSQIQNHIFAYSLPPIFFFNQS